MPKNKRTLVLNANFFPLGVISWKSAIKRYFKSDNVEIVDYYKDDYIVGTSGKHYPVPAVVRSITFIKIKRHLVPFSRKNIFIRDRLTCQYCGKSFGIKNLTYDHIIPKAKWKKQNHKKSPTIWDNIVTSCISCNRRKANRTPDEAGMSLVRQPSVPNSHGYVMGLVPWDTIPEEWNMYLTTIFRK